MSKGNSKWHKHIYFIAIIEDSWIIFSVLFFWNLNRFINWYIPSKELNIIWVASQNCNISSQISLELHISVEVINTRICRTETGMPWGFLKTGFLLSSLNIQRNMPNISLFQPQICILSFPLSKLLISLSF